MFFKGVVQDRCRELDERVFYIEYKIDINVIRYVSVVFEQQQVQLEKWGYVYDFYFGFGRILGEIRLI